MLHVFIIYRLLPNNYGHNHCFCLSSFCQKHHRSTELSLCHNMKQTMSHLTQTVKHWQLMPLCGKLLTCSFSVIFCKLARLPAQSHGTLASPACVGFWKLRETAEFLPVFTALHLPVPPFIPKSHVIRQMVDRGSQLCMVVMQSCIETRRVQSENITRIQS